MTVTAKLTSFVSATRAMSDPAAPDSAPARGLRTAIRYWAGPVARRQRQQRKHRAPGTVPEVLEDQRLHLEGAQGQDDRDRAEQPPGLARERRHAVVEIAFGLEDDPERAVAREREELQ